MGYIIEIGQAKRWLFNFRIINISHYFS